MRVFLFLGEAACSAYLFYNAARLYDNPPGTLIHIAVGISLFGGVLCAGFAKDILDNIFSS